MLAEGCIYNKRVLSTLARTPAILLNSFVLSFVIAAILSSFIKYKRLMFIGSFICGLTFLLEIGGCLVAFLSIFSILIDFLAVYIHGKRGLGLIQSLQVLGILLRILVLLYRIDCQVLRLLGRHGHR